MPGYGPNSKTWDIDQAAKTANQAWAFNILRPAPCHPVPEGGRWVASECRDRHAPLCDGCGQVVRKGDTVYHHEGGAAGWGIAGRQQLANLRLCRWCGPNAQAGRDPTDSGPGSPVMADPNRSR